MIAVRKAAERGMTINDWLASFHTFSFGEYFDPKHQHFHSLRVINEDYVAPKSGFPSHSHQDMEIMTCIISGELAHQDDMGNHSIIKPGEVQFMRAGRHVTHSEYNPSDTMETHLLQIWIMPAEKGLTPQYAQHFYSIADKKDKFCLLADHKGTHGVFKIAQKMAIYTSILEKSSKEYSVKNNAPLWVQVVSGTLQLNGLALSAGDGASIQQEVILKFSTEESVEFLLFDFDSTEK